MIPVIWHDASFGNWDSGLVAETFNKYPEHFIQYNEKNPPQFDRAIFIVVGKPEVAPVRAYLDNMKEGVVILLSDEDAYFDWKAAIPSHLKVITQYWNPEYKGELTDRILLGVPNRFKDYKINTHLPKKYLWSFIGQVQNNFRQDCVNVLSGLPDGYLYVTDKFGGYGERKFEYQDYLDVCCQSHFVVCPSGSMVCDSFRVYEGMETGAIVITEKRCPRDKEGFNYWNEVYPQHRLLVVDKWEDLLTTYNPKVLQSITTADVQNKWWFDYKKELEQKLLNIANATL